MSAEGGRGAGHELRTLLSVAWRLDRRRVVLSAVLMGVSGLTNGLALALLLPIVRSLDGGAARLPLAGVELPLPVLLALFVALTAAQALLTRASALTSTSVQLRIADRLRQQAMDAVLRARWSFVLSRRRTDVVEIVTSGATRGAMAFQQLTSVTVTGAVALTTAVVAVLVAPALALPALLGVALLGAVLARTAFGPAHRLGHEFGRHNRRLHAAMAGSLDSLRLVRTHDAAGTWSRELAEAFAGTRETQLAQVRRTATVTAVSSVGLAACAAVLVWVAVTLEIPPASIVVVLLLVARLAGHVRGLTSSGAMLLNSLPAIGDLQRLVEEAEAEREVPAGSRSARAAGADPAAPLVELRGVTYRYEGTENGVHDLDLVVPAHRVTALTGPSGSGKSTTADLVLGLLAPQDGQVLVEGAPLVAADLPWWRSRLAYVPQDTALIDASLRRNLTWSVPREVADEECWEMLERCAAGFARRLPDGLDTRLGDHGHRLSGGERQRIALARALLRRPSLLVLDEATSSLDDATEAEIAGVVAGLVPSVTVLLIAHRRSTIEVADHVVRIVSGTTA